MTQVSAALGSQKTPLQLQSIRVTGVFYYLMAAIFIVFSFWNGLFFDYSIMITSIYLFVIGIAFSIWFLRARIEINGWSVIDYLVIGYFIIYFLAAMGPANVEFAVLGSIRGLAYFILYLMIRIITGLDNRKYLLINALIVSGTIFGIYGFTNGFGTINVEGTIFDTQLRRISSNFEYPNTFAIYQAIIFLLSVTMATLETNKIKKSIYDGVNYILIDSILLTYSRGTWIVLAGTLLLLFIITPPKNKISIILSSSIPIFGAFLTLSFLSKATIGQNGILGWGSLISGIAIVILFGWFLSTISKRLSARQLKFSLFGTGIILLAGIIVVVLKSGLPQNFVQRIASINLEQFSVVQRFILYKDGLKILSEYPILGAGPNAWQALQGHYQSYPYISRQSHSLLIDTIMSVGTLGTLVFVGMLGVLLWKAIAFMRTLEQREHMMQSTFLCSLIGLLGHSLIDFDFAYGTINFLFWSLIALLVPKLTVKQPRILSAKVNIPTYLKTSIVSGMVVSIVGGIIAFGFLLSNKYLSNSDIASKTQGANKALAAAENATIVAPYRASTWLTRAKYEELMYQIQKKNDWTVKINDSVERAASLASHDPETLRQVAIYLAKYGDGLKTVDVARQAWENGYYKIENPEMYIGYSNAVGRQLYTKDKNRSKTFFQQAINTYNDVRRRLIAFKELPKGMRAEYKYDITPDMRLSAGESAYHLGQYDEVEKILQTLIKDENSKGNGTAKVILAATNKKQGKTVNSSLMASIVKNKQLKELYDRLIQVEPLK